LKFDNVGLLYSTDYFCLDISVFTATGAQIFGENVASNAELNIRAQKGFGIQCFDVAVDNGIKVNKRYFVQIACC